MKQVTIICLILAAVGALGKLAGYDRPWLEALFPLLIAFIFWAVHLFVSGVTWFYETKVFPLMFGPTDRHRRDDLLMRATEKDPQVIMMQPRAASLSSVMSRPPRLRDLALHEDWERESHSRLDQPF